METEEQPIGIFRGGDQPEKEGSSLGQGQVDPSPGYTCGTQSWHPTPPSLTTLDVDVQREGDTSRAIRGGFYEGKSMREML